MSDASVEANALTGAAFREPVEIVREMRGFVRPGGG